MKSQNIEKIEFAGIWLPTEYNKAFVSINVWYCDKGKTLGGSTQTLPPRWDDEHLIKKMTNREQILIRNAVEVCEHINSSGRV